MSSLSDVNVASPVQPQATSTAAGSSLFAGLSVKDNISPTPAASVPSNLTMTSTTSSKPPGSMTNVSNMNTGILLPQSASVIQNQPMTSVSRALSSNTTYQPSTSGILQPQTQSQPISAANVPMLNAMSTHLPNSTMLQPQPMTSYNNTITEPTQSGRSYQPPPIVQPSSTVLQPNNVPAAKTISPSMTEAPPPYPGHEKYSTTASNFRTGTQQPTLMPSPKSIVTHQMRDSSHLSAQSPASTANVPSSFNTNMLQPQPPNVLQSAQQAMNSQGASSLNNMSSGGMQPQGSYRTGFGTNMLQPQQPIMSSPVVKPQIAGTGNIQPSVTNFTDLSISNPMQMYGAPRVPMQGAAHVVDPRGHSNATAGVLLPQHSSIASTPAGMPQGSHPGTTGLFQQPLIATPPAAQTSQGARYKMAPGVNPFSDINDLL